MENGSPVRFHVEEQVNLRQKINEAGYYQFRCET